MSLCSWWVIFFLIHNKNFFKSKFTIFCLRCFNQLYQSLFFITIVRSQNILLYTYSKTSILKNGEYQSKWVVTRTSEQGCPPRNDVISQLWYLQIGIECNIVIITDINITSATPVTLSFWLIFGWARNPNPRKYVFTKELLIDYFPVHNRAHNIGDFNLFVFSHNSARTIYALKACIRQRHLVKIDFLCLVWQSLRRALVQI